MLKKTNILVITVLVIKLFHVYCTTDGATSVIWYVDRLVVFVKIIEHYKHYYDDVAEQTMDTYLKPHVIYDL